MPVVTDTAPKVERNWKKIFAKFKNSQIFSKKFIYLMS